MPSELMDKNNMQSKREKKKTFGEKVFPGIITGASDNDPAGIASYSISGAQFGYQQLWLMVLAIPLLIAVQSMCARIGDVKKKGLSSLFKENFHPSIAWFATLGLIFANVFTIGADIVAMGSVLQLVSGIDYRIWVVPITLLIAYIVIFRSFKFLEKYFKYLTLFFFSYILAAFFAKPDWLDVLKNIFTPSILSMSNEFWLAAVAILGTTITPYLFYWETKEKIEEKENRSDSLEDAKREDYYNAPGFIFSQMITLFIMIATGATLFAHGIQINSAAEAASALEPFAGSLSKWLFTIGILGSGFLAIPILSASTGYVVADTAGWTDSLDSKLKNAKGFYITIILSLLAGIVVVIFGIDPIRALFYSQVVNGILGPFLIILILILANRKKVMKNFTNGWFDNIFGILAVIIMTTAVLLTFIHF